MHNRRKTFTARVILSDYYFRFHGSFGKYGVEQHLYLDEITCDKNRLSGFIFGFHENEVGEPSENVRPNKIYNSNE